MVRRRLVAMVVAVLASQAAGIAAAPLAFFEDRAAASTASEPIACTCPGGGMGKECPMHKHRPPASSPDTPRYVSCHSSTEIALTTLVGVTGLLAEGQQTEVPDGVSEAVVAASTEPLNLIRPPVSPPPRS